MVQPRLKLCCVSLKQANDYVSMFHRHARPVQGHKFSLGVMTVNIFCPQILALEGVAIVGRPVARALDDGNTLEVRRIAIAHQTPNGCSFLLAACRRIARRLGYRRLITYTLETEPGTSLRAAGWVPVALTRGGSWSRAGRPRSDHQTGRKIRWLAP